MFTGRRKWNLFRFRFSKQKVWRLRIKCCPLLIVRQVSKIPIKKVFAFGSARYIYWMPTWCFFYCLLFSPIFNGMHATLSHFGRMVCPSVSLLLVSVSQHRPNHTLLCIRPCFFPAGIPYALVSLQNAAHQSWTWTQGSPSLNDYSRHYLY